MHAQKFARVAVENKFQHALVVATNLSARTFGITRHANFIGHQILGQFLFGGSNHAQLGHGINSIGPIFWNSNVWQTKHVARSNAALLVTGCRQSRRANHITRRVDIFNRGAVALIHFNSSALIRGKTHRLQIQTLNVALTPRAGQHHIRHNHLATFHFNGHSGLGSNRATDAGHFFIQAESHAFFAHLMHKLVH